MADRAGLEAHRRPSTPVWCLPCLPSALRWRASWPLPAVRLRGSAPDRMLQPYRRRPTGGSAWQTSGQPCHCCCPSPGPDKGPVSVMAVKSRGQSQDKQEPMRTRSPVASRADHPSGRRPAPRGLLLAAGGAVVVLAVAGILTLALPAPSLTPVEVAERYLEARNAYDVGQARALVADDFTTTEAPDGYGDVDGMELAFAQHEAYGFHYAEVDCTPGDETPERATVSCEFLWTTALHRIGDHPPTPEQLTVIVEDGRIAQSVRGGPAWSSAEIRSWWVPSSSSWWSSTLSSGAWWIVRWISTRSRPASLSSGCLSILGSTRTGSTAKAAEPAHSPAAGHRRHSQATSVQITSPVSPWPATSRGPLRRWCRQSVGSPHCQCLDRLASSGHASSATTGSPSLADLMRCTPR
jgi:hypothetical protein